MFQQKPQPMMGMGMGMQYSGNPMGMAPKQSPFG